MDYKIDFMVKGYKPLCFFEEKLLVYKKGNLYLMDTENYSFSFITSFDFSLKERIISNSRILTRLFRMEPRLAIISSDRKAYIAFKGKIYCLNIEEKTLKVEHSFKVKMSSPLELVKIQDIKGFKNQVCYGEYPTSNPNKNEISIYSKDENENEWRIKYTFPKGKIDHIHSVISDKYRDRVWILTGDFGTGAGIFYTEDDFKTVKEFLVGKQLYRSCVLFPQEKGIIYATDSPDEENSINFIDLTKEEIRIDKLRALEGSCIYGAQVGDKLVFSTTVEPSTEGNNRYLDLLSYKRGRGIKSWNCELVVGNLSEGFERVAEFKKDVLPMGLLQFGTITFPRGESKNDQSLYFYGSSLRRIDGKLMTIKLKKGKTK